MQHLLTDIFGKTSLQLYKRMEGLRIYINFYINLYTIAFTYNTLVYNRL